MSEAVRTVADSPREDEANAPSDAMEAAVTPENPVAKSNTGESAATKPSTTKDSTPATDESSTAGQRPQQQSRPRRFDDLPSYSRNLLKIEVPVVVILARRKYGISKIRELAPGSIVQFDKLCDEMLELSVGDHVIAEGETVKIGDKFGLRLTSIRLPEERPQPLRPNRKSAG